MVSGEIHLGNTSGVRHFRISFYLKTAYYLTGRENKEKKKNVPATYYEIIVGHFETPEFGDTLSGLVLVPRREKKKERKKSMKFALDKKKSTVKIKK